MFYSKQNWFSEDFFFPRRRFIAPTAFYRWFQVHIKSNFIMNGVCVRWRGWIDLERLDGVGCLEFNEDRAAIEDNILREQIQRYNERLRDYEDKQRGYRQQDRSDQDLDVRNYHSN